MVSVRLCWSWKATVPSRSYGFIPRDVGRERREGPGWITRPPPGVAFWPKVVKFCLEMVPLGLGTPGRGYYRGSGTQGPCKCPRKTCEHPSAGISRMVIDPRAAAFCATLKPKTQSRSVSAAREGGKSSGEGEDKILNNGESLKRWESLKR